MNMKLLITASLVCALVGIQSCGNRADPAVNQSENKTLKAAIASDSESDDQWKILEDSLYTLKYPANWKLGYTGQEGISMGALSPLESDTDQFRENVTLIVQHLQDKTMDLDTFVDQNAPKIRKAIANSKLVEDKTGNTGDATYRQIQYTGTQSDYTLLFTQRFYVHNGYVFIFSFTCQKSKYDEYKPVGFKILNSLVLK